ncbi:MAG: hypothetical protein JXJ20_13205 [Anaerolineae bacterium]|nr:hypothetical protein [Anaerolineae bacterium]
MAHIHVYLRRGAVVIGLALALAACGSDNERTGPTPTATGSPTALPVTPTALPPTWTATPPTAPLPTQTTVPTFTPRPTLTLTPGLTPGAVWEDDTRLVVTARAAKLNVAIREEFNDAAFNTGEFLGKLFKPPMITLDYGGRVQIDLDFYNAFLEREGHIHTEALVSVQDGVLVLDEIADAREAEGALVNENDVRAGLAVAADGITRGLLATAGDDLPESFRLAEARIYPGHVEAVFTAD